MQSLIAELLFKTSDIFSICCASAEGKGYILTLEQTDDPAVPLSDGAMPKVAFRLWGTHRGHPTFELLAHGETPMPQADSASMQICKNQIDILFECNRQRAAVLAQWNVDLP